ncbi:hypothetical protein GCM10008018_72170 [Paenibacillus marchantiophytorum]|uniref:Uncharacterized protein n=1 Tax=Paenibacillus marchantiophytorum TaxID=1619310 RepID=A0ABQ1FKR6_9BACL|nr:hypothetical protein [Paenibacillus marchantiophytorum]GGA17526.1 hypothetical protein GCM10008018_72170 [Paenibacillus marchantiophytorum]
MTENKITIIKDVFKNEKNGVLTDGITIIIDGQLKQVLDIISSKESFGDYTETVKEVLFTGINQYIEKYKKEK